MYKEFKVKESGAASMSQFWDAHWDSCESDIDEMIRTMERRDVLVEFFEDSVYPDGKILEAGCGISQYVSYFSRKKQKIYGLDFALGTLIGVKRVQPNLNLIAGDLRNIPSPDHTFQNIICLGVIEHYEEGADEILKELKRVLSKKGFLYVSVPYESLSFRFVNWMKGWVSEEEREPVAFYQYRYRKNEIKKIVINAGYEIKDVKFYSCIDGMRGKWSTIKDIFCKHYKKGTKKASINEIREIALVRRRNPLIKMVYPLLRFIDSRMPFFAHMVILKVSRARN